MPAVSDRPVNFSPSGPPATVLDAEPSDALTALGAALGAPSADRRDRVAAVAARWPRFLAAWAELGDLGRDPTERYAAYRVGYHRGLDRLRANGWRGSGEVRWAHVENLGFLRSLRGLQEMATAIDERDEAERCALFLVQLDPSHPKGT